MEIKKWLTRGFLGLGIAGGVAAGVALAEQRRDDTRVEILSGQIEKISRRLKATEAFIDSQWDSNYTQTFEECRVRNTPRENCYEIAEKAVEEQQKRLDEYLNNPDPDLNRSMLFTNR